MLSSRGQDPMRANFMRKDNFEFRPVCKLVMFGNHKPTLPDVGKAVRKRIRLVPCNLRLQEGEMDRDLPVKLMNEGPGILRAFIDGCLDWQAHGLITPACVDEQTENYFSAQDIRKQWFDECCIIDPNSKVSSTDVWRSWVTWAKHREFRTGTDVALSEWLENCGYGFTRVDARWDTAQGVGRIYSQGRGRNTFWARATASKRISL